MVTAVALFSLMDAQLKLLAEHYPPLQVAFLRGLLSLPFVAVPVLVRGKIARLRPVNLPLHLLRGVMSVVMLTAFVYAVRETSITATYSIFMCAPLVVAGLSVPMLGEKVARSQWIAIGVGLAGVLLMLRPGSGRWGAAGSIAAVIAVAMYALSVITLRRLSQTDTTESMVFSFALLLSIGAGVLAIPGWVPLIATDWPLFVGVGLTGAVAQGFITNAFRHAPASVVTPFEYTALVWGVILDLTIWHVLPSGITLLGGSIVIAAGLYIILRERSAGAIAAHP
jgi:drug/metabolite transporter (DMT)-like permease